MARVPSFAKTFAGRWRIVEMDNWDTAFLDLVKEVHLTFQGKSMAKSPLGLSRASWTCAMALAADRSPPSSHGKGTTRMIRPVITDGL
ncbi:hypothetical protein ABIB90_007867 [Bradyrhizobium sp. JR4.1]